MVLIEDDGLKVFCEPVLDVKYVCSCVCKHLEINSIEQYIDLAYLYHKSALNTSSSYINICIDENNVKYAKICFKGVRYALNMNSPLIPTRSELKHIKNVSLRKAKNLQGSSLEDTVDSPMNSYPMDLEHVGMETDVYGTGKQPYSAAYLCEILSNSKLLHS